MNNTLGGASGAALSTAVPTSDDYTARWALGAQPDMVDIGSGLTLRCLRLGKGQPLVLIHTIRTQLDYFQRLAPLLESDYALYLVDLPGHGRSTIPYAEQTEPFLRGSVAALINKLNLREVVLAGESIGGTLAMTTSVEIPSRISRVVAINPYDYGESFGGGIRRSKSGWIISLFSIFGRYTLENRFILAKVLAGGFSDPGRLPEELLTEFLRSGRRKHFRAAEYSLFRNWRTWLQARSSYSLLSKPITLVYSNLDWSSQLDRDKNKQEIPNATTVTLQDCGHFSSLERPKEVADAIRRPPR